MEDNKIAQEQYTVTVDGVTYLYTLTLEKSGAFSYGNGTCMVVSVDAPGVPDNYYDTRYCGNMHTPELFHDWSLKWLKDYCRPDAVIARA